MLPEIRHLILGLLAGTALSGLVRPSSVQAQALPVPPPQQPDAAVVAATLRAMSAYNAMAVLKDKYTPQQRADHVERAQHNKDYPYYGRNNPDSVRAMFEVCALADDAPEKVPPSVKHLWENMQVLKNSPTLLGPILAQFSVKNDIFYCAGTPKKAYGVWHQELGRAEVKSGPSQIDQLYTQVHEATHAIQQSQGTFEMPAGGLLSLRDAQMFEMSYEAAAAAAERLQAFDEYLNRDQSYWKAIKSLHSVQAGKIESAYYLSFRKGAPREEALAAAGAVAFETMFQNQAWLDDYNNNVLGDYIGWMMETPAKPVAAKGYTIDDARKTGWISPTFNFTAGLTALPIDSARFGNNALMRQIFDFVELERLGQTEGCKSTAYVNRRAELQRQKNPYLSIDLREIHDKISPKDSEWTVSQAMNMLAGVSRGKTKKCLSP